MVPRLFFPLPVEFLSKTNNNSKKKQKSKIFFKKNILKQRNKEINEISMS